MTAKGTVVSVTDTKALVEVRRRAMCDGCPNDPSDPNSCGHSCAMGSLLGERKSMQVTVENTLGAKAGDTVELESSDRHVLFSAFLVFVLPLILCATMFVVAQALSLGESLCYIFVAAGFVFSFVLCLIAEKRAKKNGSRIVMRSILSSSEN